MDDGEARALRGSTCLPDEKSPARQTVPIEVRSQCTLRWGGGGCAGRKTRDLTDRVGRRGLMRTVTTPMGSLTQIVRESASIFHVGRTLSKSYPADP